MNCIDTNTLIYAVTTDPPPAIVPLCVEAQGAIERLSTAGLEVAVPGICVAENLAGIPEADRAGVASLFARRFRVLDFTPACWPFAARILAAKAQLREAQTAPGATRQSVRVDSFVLATVWANGGTLVTDDEGLTKLAAAMGVPAVTPAGVLRPGP
ncbi:MAG: type II toxin-antitoxin system VapC family toxin [Gemmataceae bacterium]